MTAEQTARSPEVALAISERYEALRAEIIAQGEGQAPDRYMKAFYQRCVTELDTNEDFRATVIEYLEQNPEDEPTYGANKVFRSVQYSVMPDVRPESPSIEEPDYRDASYPRGRHKPEAWDDAFQAIQTPFGRLQFRQHLIRELIQTNVAQRGSVLRVAAQLYGIKRAKIYSGGCSMGHIEKLMELYDGERFKYPSVAVGNRKPDRLLGFERSRTATQHFAQLLHSHEFHLGPSLGDDLAPPTFTAALNWARSCTFRPSEFANDKHRNLVQLLTTTDIPQLKFHQGDFTLPDHVRYLRDKNPRWRKDRFNMAIFATSLYQCSEEGRQQAIANAQELTSDDGIIAVLDFAHLGADGKLDFVPKWRDWDYNLFVLDKAKPDAGWQHIFGAREGRVREVVFGQHLSKIAFGALRG